MRGKTAVGNLFFSGCSLRCVFCQNISISQEGGGRWFSEEDLEAACWRLQEEGASCLSFVTAEHYCLQLLPLMRRLKSTHYPLPLVWNSSAFQKVESLRQLEGLVDVYLPDLKFFAPEVSKLHTGRADYFEVALAALDEMIRQQAFPHFQEGQLMKGVALRHLILPGQWKDSLALLHFLAKERPALLHFPLALMAQYTPDFYCQRGGELAHLRRRLTTFEYQKVVEAALQLGFEHLLGQERAAAKADFTPDFW